MRTRSLALLFVAGLLMVSPGCTGLFFRPSRIIVDDALVRKYQPLDVYFNSSDGLMLHGWFFKAREEKGTILVCHGNVQNIGTHAKLDLWLIDKGYNLFIFDYRGYGRSQGTPDMKGVHRDAEAALEAVLFALPRERHDDVIVFGKSLGGAISVYTVANSPYKHRVKALILDSVFSSYRMLAREKVSTSIIGWPFQYPLSYLVNDDYSPIRFIDRIAPVPVMIIHGIDDPVVPAHHGRMLFDAALPPKEFWEILFPGHVLSQADEAIRSRILHFIEDGN